MSEAGFGDGLSWVGGVVGGWWLVDWLEGGGESEAEKRKKRKAACGEGDRRLSLRQVWVAAIAAGRRR